MTRPGPLLTLLLALLLAGAATPARAADRLELRVVTLDVVQGGGPRLGAALAGLRPDVVCLQSVWSDADAEAITAALREAGLTHAARFPSRLRGSGLLIASRWPLGGPTFAPFTLAGAPHQPRASEWWDGPGLARVGVDTPLGRVLVADTRLHARGTDDEFLLHRLGQSLEVADALGDHGARPPEHDHDPARPPLLLAGRLDLDPDGVPWRLLTTRADLTPASTPPASEALLYRPGGDVAFKVRDVGPALDGAGLVAALELRRLGRAPRPGLQALSVRWQAAASEARPLVEAELEACRARGAAHRARGLLLALVGVVLMAAGRRWKGKRRGCLLPLLALVPLHAAVWSTYLGAVHERLLERGLVKAAHQLDTD